MTRVVVVGPGAIGTAIAAALHETGRHEVVPTPVSDVIVPLLASCDPVADDRS